MLYIESYPTTCIGSSQRRSPQNSSERAMEYDMRGHRRGEPSTHERKMRSPERAMDYEMRGHRRGEASTHERKMRSPERAMAYEMRGHRRGEPSTHERKMRSPPPSHRQSSQLHRDHHHSPPTKATPPSSRSCLFERKILPIDVRQLDDGLPLVNGNAEAVRKQLTEEEKAQADHGRGLVMSVQDEEGRRYPVVLRRRSGGNMYMFCGRSWRELVKDHRLQLDDILRFLWRRCVPRDGTGRLYLGIQVVKKVIPKKKTTDSSNIKWWSPPPRSGNTTTSTPVVSDDKRNQRSSRPMAVFFRGTSDPS